MLQLAAVLLPAAAAAAAGVNSCATQLEHEVHQLARRLAAARKQHGASRARPQMAASKSVIILVVEAAAAAAVTTAVAVVAAACLFASRMNIAQVLCAAPKLFGFGLTHTHTQLVASTCPGCKFLLVLLFRLPLLADCCCLFVL